MARNTTTPAQREADRQRIREHGDPIGLLISVVRGEPIPIRNVDGEIVRWEQAETGHRLACAKHLLDRVSPTLQSMKLEDLENTGNQITIISPFALPGSQRPGAQPPDALPQPAPLPEIETPEPTPEPVRARPETEDAEVVPEPASEPASTSHKGPKSRRRIRSTE